MFIFNINASSALELLLNLLLLIISSTIAISIREFIKAFLSNAFGDTKPASNHRLTLNPVAHIDILGLACAVFYGYGWGKPLETSSINYKNRKLNTMYIFIVATLVNIFLGILFYYLSNYFLEYNNQLSFFCKVFSYNNLAIAIFNFIPIQPCDMSTVVTVFLPPNNLVKYFNSQNILKMILIFSILWSNYLGEIIAYIIGLFGFHFY